jgi:hypothetical protein
LLKSVNLQSSDSLISFGVVSLFTSAPGDEAPQVIRNKLHKDVTLAEESALQFEDIMELLGGLPENHIFSGGRKVLPTENDMAMGNSLSPIVSNIFMGYFEKLGLDLAQHKPSLWLRYVDDTFGVWPHGPSQLQDFLNHLSSLRPSIQFVIEIESENAIAFLDVLVIREEATLTTKVYRKPTDNCRNPSFNSNHPPHVNRG